ncbi:MAG: hypothetical protein ACTHPS_08490, partial [Streptosporangiaceae bacterium]
STRLGCSPGEVMKNIGILLSGRGSNFEAIAKNVASGREIRKIGRTKRSDRGFHPDANTLWSIRIMANAGTIEIQSHGSPAVCVD